MSIFLEVAKYSPNYKEIEWLTMEGVRGGIEWRRGFWRRIELLKGLDKKYFIKTIDEMRIREHVKPVVNELKKMGLKVGIISGGFDILADKVRNILQLDFTVSNRLIFNSGKLSGALLIVSGHKENILMSISEKFKIPLLSTVVVVDGANDLTMVKAVGLSIGFKPKEIVREHVNIVIDDDIQKIIPPIKSFFKYSKRVSQSPI